MGFFEGYYGARETVDADTARESASKQAKGVADILQKELDSAKQPAPQQGPTGSQPDAKPTDAKTPPVPGGTDFWKGTPTKEAAKGDDVKPAENLGSLIKGSADGIQLMQQRGQRLQALMMNAAKNNDPAGALAYRTQLDNLTSDAEAKQSEHMDYQQKQWQVGYQLGKQYESEIENATTDEEKSAAWTNFLKNGAKDAGIDPAGIMGIPPDKREAYVKSVMTKATDAKQDYNMMKELRASKEKTREFDIKEDEIKAHNRETEALTAQGRQTQRLLASVALQSLTDKAEDRKLSREVKLEAVKTEKVRNQANQIDREIGRADTDVKQATKEWTEANDDLTDALASKTSYGDTDANKAEIKRLTALKASKNKEVQDAKAKVKSLEKVYSDVISGDEPTKTEAPKSDYDTYKELWNAAKGDSKEQARLTAIARQHKIVK